jgi:hypothetical protein
MLQFIPEALLRLIKENYWICAAYAARVAFNGERKINKQKIVTVKFYIFAEGLVSVFWVMMRCCNLEG